MLIETRIGFMFREMSEKELRDAVLYAQGAMREAGRESGEPVALYGIARLQATQIVFSIQTLRTRAMKNYVYDYVKREIFCFPVACSHLDIHERFAAGLNGEWL